MDNVACEGTEDSLDKCQYNTEEDCGVAEGAGVVCDRRSIEEINAEKRIIQDCFDDETSYDFGNYLDFEVSDSPISCQKHCQAHNDCIHFTFYEETNKCYRKTKNTKKSVRGATSGPRNCSDLSYTMNPDVVTTPKTCESPDMVCLTGGRDSAEGNVLVGNRPVCDDDWNLINANVVCKQLGFIGALEYTKESRFGMSGSNYIMDQVVCDGTEERLIDCEHEHDQHDCSRGEDAGVKCDTRTMDQEQVNELTCFTEGTAYSAGEWLDFDVVSSAYECQIHCRAHTECTFFTFYRNSNKCYRKSSNNPTQTLHAVSGPRHCTVNSTDRTTTELPTRDCNTPGVVCLRGGNDSTNGNVYIGGKPICDDNWDTRDARKGADMGYPLKSIFLLLILLIRLDLSGASKRHIK